MILPIAVCQAAFLVCHQLCLMKIIESKFS